MLLIGFLTHQKERARRLWHRAPRRCRLTRSGERSDCLNCVPRSGFEHGVQLVFQSDALQFLVFEFGR